MDLQARINQASEDDCSLYQSLFSGIKIATHRQKNGCSILHLSVKAGKAKLTKFCIESGCDVNAQDMNGNVPLMYALHLANRKKRLPLVKLLVEAGAKFDIRNSNRKDVFNACFSNDDKVEFDDLASAKILLDAGANVNIKNLRGETALHTAANCLRPKSVDFLLEHKADVKIADRFGYTALGSSLYLNSSDSNQDRAIKVLKSLINHGANINLKNDRKAQTPFHYALQGKASLKTIEFLIQNGADINIKAHNGKGPLHFAAIGDVNVLHLLLEKGCDIKDRDNKGRTVVHRAFKYGRIENIIFLCKNGGNINDKSSTGITPIHTLIQAYRDLGPLMNIPSKLFDAILNKKNVEIVADLVVSLGADVNAITNNGETILDTAKSAIAKSAENIVLKLLAKLEFSGDRISKPLKYKIKNTKKYAKFFNDCLAELSVIKNYAFYGTTQIHPIFAGDQKTIAEYVENRNLRKAFKAINFTETFPIYGELMKKRFYLGASKRALRMDAAESLSKMLPEAMQTEKIVQKIISHISDKDLVKFMEEEKKYVFINITNGVYKIRPFQLKIN